MAVVAVARRAVVSVDQARGLVLAQGGLAEAWGSCDDRCIAVSVNQEMRLKLQAAVRVATHIKLTGADLCPNV